MLKKKLEGIGVDVRVETFEEGQGIAALGEDPFVSCSKVVHSETKTVIDMNQWPLITHHI